VQGRELDPLLGVGGRLRMGPRITLLLEFDRYWLDGEAVNVMGLGIQYRLQR
jgi:hypothetical protein